MAKKDCILSLISILTFNVMVFMLSSDCIFTFLTISKINICVEKIWISCVLTLFWLGFVMFIKWLPKKIKNKISTKCFDDASIFFQKIAKLGVYLKMLLMIIQKSYYSSRYFVWKVFSIWFLLKCFCKNCKFKQKCQHKSSQFEL